ncbi:MAG TPA: hypothetical protein PK530_24130, partial [Anaerolineales bacterium]|nr:hypothetical protein [Anaerolineales bacterium]
AQAVARKTPVLLHIARMAGKATRVMRGDQAIIDQITRDLFPMLQDDSPQPPQLQSGDPLMPQQPLPQPQKVAPNSSIAAGRRTSIYKGLTALPALLGYQIVIYGPTGSGKSSVIKALLLARQDADVIILDPHYAPGSWPSRVTIAGAGLNWGAIDQAIDVVHTEMQVRYQTLAHTPAGQAHFKPLILAVDELSALTGHIPDAGKRLFDLAQQGRKVQVWLMLTPHSTEVEQMGAQGRGDARENFAYVEMPFVPAEDKYKPRIVTVYYGNPRRKDNAPVGQFVVPAPKIYTGTPDVNPAWIAPERPRVQPVSKPQPQHGIGFVSRPEFGRKSTLDTPTPTRTYAEFVALCGRTGQEIEPVILYLLTCGYGARKIGEFLPFATNEARQRVNAVRAAHPEVTPNPRPTAGSADEKALVQYLTGLGAPLPRIATLLDGNDGENLTRISAY